MPRSIENVLTYASPIRNSAATVRIVLASTVVLGLVAAAIAAPKFLSAKSPGRPHLGSIDPPPYGLLAGVLYQVAVANRPEAPPLPEPAEDVRDGLALTIAPANAPEHADTRRARMVALNIPQGTAPTPFVASGKFVAEWNGDLSLRLRDYYAFAATGRGKLTVKVNDQVVLDAAGDDLSKATGTPIRLSKGKSKFAARYESPDAGDANVRLFWTTMVKAGEAYAPGQRLLDPVPPTVFKHDAGAVAIATGTRLREGRMLLAELRCVKCHAAGDLPGTGGADLAAVLPPIDPAAAVKPGPMPELMMDAPSLADAGARFSREWLAAWINDPKSLRADAHMPRVFHDAAGKAEADAIDPRAADVAAYLATLGKAGDAADATEAAEPDAAKAEAGGKLYVNLNCTACHTAPDYAAPPEAAAEATAGHGAALALPRVPHKHVRAKYKPDALKQYLLNPNAHYAWNPMPNFRLDAAGAEALAAYLLANAPEKLEPPAEVPAGDAAKGKLLVASSGCLNCHAIGGDTSELRGPSLAEIPKDGWTRGCLAKEPQNRKPSAPDFKLSDGQRNAILAFAATDRTSLTRDAAAEFSQRQVQSMRCTACHARDGTESDLVAMLDQEFKDLQGKFPTEVSPEDTEKFAPDQRPPQLTWVGEKLNPTWMADFIAGTTPYKPRPYLHARMPGFTARAGLLSAGLAAEHGLPPTDEPKEKPDAAMATAGRQLVGKAPNVSFSCVQCHAVAATPPLAPFEAPAVNFAYSADRLRKDYYHRWVHNPQKIDPETKMPAFERDDRKTTITAHYEGDAAKQWEAIWQYLLGGKEIPPPTE